MKSSILRTLRAALVATTLTIALSVGAVYSFVIVAMALAPSR